MSHLFRKRHISILFRNKRNKKLPSGIKVQLPPRNDWIALRLGFHLTFNIVQEKSISFSFARKRCILIFVHCNAFDRLINLNYSRIICFDRLFAFNAWVWKSSSSRSHVRNFRGRRRIDANRLIDRMCERLFLSVPFFYPLESSVLHNWEVKLIFLLLLSRMPTFDFHAFHKLIRPVDYLLVRLDFFTISAHSLSLMSKLTHDKHDFLCEFQRNFFFSSVGHSK